MTLASGTRFGIYEIVALLGKGGMGEVYRATDTKLHRDVAIKVLPAEVATDPERLARFEREARLLASLNHPNIAHVYGFESASLADGSSAYFLAMELVEGEELAELLERRRLPVEEAIEIAKQIAEALEVAHEKGIVHRDLKPANVKVTPEDKVKVLDFGLAKAYAGDSAGGSSADLSQSPTLAHTGTQAGVILGTAAYMSPEQARGKPVDRRADIWSFGVVLFEMLAGEPLFYGETISDIMAAVLKEAPSWSDLPKETPASVLHLLRRCLTRDPRHRLRDMGEARIALSDTSDHWFPAASSSASSVAFAGTADRHRRDILRLAAGALIIAALATGVTLWAARRAAPSSPGMPIQTSLTRITSDSGLTMDPAVSPTGSLLAYASDRGGASLNIWVQPLPTGQPVQVTHGDVDCHQPSFSPDGSRIVFRSERDGGAIYIVPALGGTQRLVAPKGHSPQFSPDGRRIAYGTGGRGSARELWVVDEAGGVPKRVGADLTDWGGLIWSPDGAALVVAGFVKDREKADWYRVDVANGSVSSMRAEAMLKSSGVFASPIGAWLPGEIVFSARSGDSQSLWSVGVSADGRSVKGPLLRLTAGTGLDQSPAIASGSQERQVYFASLDERVNLYRLPIAANEGRATGEPQALTDAAAQDMWPSISADGKSMVFASDRQSSLGIWLKNLDSLQEIPLGGAAKGFVNISPDGQRVAYSLESQDKSRYAVRPVAGGAAQEIPWDLVFLWDWPTSTLLITNGEGDDRNKLHAFDLATGKLRPLLTGTTGEFYGHGRISPDGRWMSAMEWTTAGRSRIIVFPFRETPVLPAEFVVVSDDDSVAEENAWSPDGQFLYFVSERDGSRCVWARRLDPRTKQPVGPATAVAHLHGSRRSIVSTGQSPARLALGRNELIFCVQLRRGNIWKVTLREP